MKTDQNQDFFNDTLEQKLSGKARKVVHFYHLLNRIMLDMFTLKYLE